VNWFAIGISIAVVVVLIGIGVAVWWGNSMANSAGEAPDSPAVNAETGAISVGEGSNQLDLYFDFYCPHCQEFEAAYGPTVEQILNDGEVTLGLHPVALTGLNAASGTDFSRRSANALYCVAVAEPEAAYPFMQDVFATNPTGPGLTDEELISLAESAGASDVSQCITDRTYDRYVAARSGDIPANPTTGSAGTPTIVLNDEWIGLTGDPEADLVARLN
jgi:protein-disulfide isomerase